ncbi:MAG TPA: FAD:protein FMN transferase [Solirubrobacteraceae bacterium]
MNVSGGFVTATWEALGTSILLRLCRSSASDGAPELESRLAAARLAVERELDAIDRACSRFRADSELSRVNASGGRPTAVSELLAQALELALRAAELTDGDVDPTVGRALELAGYDRDWGLLGVAREAQPDTARPSLALSAHVRSGWRTIALDCRTLTVRVPRGIGLDLGATAKAWVADRAAAAAARAAECGALVSVGGDISTAGPAPAGGWRIRVTDDHRSDPSAAGQTVCIRSGGLATSSTSVRRWRQGGRAMHHIIDPRTGQPARSGWRTVSVAAANCVDANIAATAAIVRSGRGTRWLSDAGLPARLVSRRGYVTAVAGWPQEAGR